jgi:hypothetical protein
MRRRYSSVVGYSPDSTDVSTEAKESPLLAAVTKQRPGKTLKAGEDVEISGNVIVTYL